MRVALLAVAVAACKFTPNAAAIDAATAGDDDAPSIDAAFVATDAPDQTGSICAGTFMHICVETQPPDRPTYPPFDIDTGIDTNCDEIRKGPIGPEACIVYAHDFHVTGTVGASGTRVLVLVAFNNLEVADNVEIDASAGVLGPGPASDDTSCERHTGGSGVAGAGGAGGSHQGKGGNGGDAGPPTTTGGSAQAAVTAWTFARGGCPGGSGGTAVGGGGPGGSGGGAVVLIAGAKIKLGKNSAINASGAGGSGAGDTAGGGGGGSGGFIGLDAPTLDIQADTRIMANGGGGGSGGAPTFAGELGDDGKDTDNVARGGTFGGANGGDGSIDVMLAGSTGANGAPAIGAGGGGGGAGVILAFDGDTQMGMYSPAKLHP